MTEKNINLQLTRNRFSAVKENLDEKNTFLNNLINNTSHTNTGLTKRIETSNSKEIFFDLPVNNSSTNRSLSRSAKRFRNDGRRFFDLNKDGVVSDSETIDFILKSRSRGSSATKGIYPYNKNADEFDRIAKSFDKNKKDGVFSDEETIRALLDLNTKEFSDIKRENANLILSSNTNFDNIKQRIELINKNSDGNISDIEVLSAIRDAKQGLYDINDQFAQEILKTNSNFEKIARFLENVHGNFDGEITDQIVFDVLMSIRAGNISEHNALMSIFLETNPNSEKIANSIELIDKTDKGIISKEEYIDFILDTRKGIINAEDHENLITILEQDTVFQNLKNTIDFIDKKADGIIDDEDIIELALAFKKGNINLDPLLVDIVMSKNINSEKINELINSIDKNSNAEIDHEEIFNTIIGLRNGQIDNKDLNLIYKILNKNPNLEKMKFAIESIDQDGDGRVSNYEYTQAELEYRQGLIQDIDTWNSVLSSNPDSEKLQKIINHFDEFRNGIINPLVFTDKILSYRQNPNPDMPINIFNDVVETIDQDLKLLNFINVFDNQKNGIIDEKSFARGVLAARADLIKSNDELINSIMNRVENGEIILESINILDADKNGVVNADEFVNNFQASISVNGVVDFNRMSIISNLLEVIYPDAIKLDKFRDDIDLNNDNQLSDQELITGLINLRNGSLTNPGLDIIRVVISGNPNYRNIIDVIEKIDSDKDGVISNYDTLTGLLLARKGMFSNEQLPIAQAILMRNPKNEELQNLLNIFDKDLNGEISKLELTDAIFKFRRGEIETDINTDILEALKNLNPNRRDIERLIETVDPNGSGKIENDELIRGLLAINSGTIERPDNEILINLPNENGSDFGDEIFRKETLIRQIDQNRNGQFGDNEIASIILANRAHGTLNGFDEGFVDTVFATNPKSTEIMNLIDYVDADGDGFIADTELVDSILAFHKGDINVSSNELFDMILSNHSEYNRFKTLTNQIDVDRNGVISDQNLVEFFFQANNSNYDARSQDILNLILNKNNSRTSLENSYKLLETISNGNLMRMKNTLLELSFGETINPAFQNLVEPASSLINTWNQQVNSAYLQEVSSMIDTVINNSQNKNLDSLGIERLETFIISLNNIKNNLVNGKKSSYNELQNLIDDYRSTTESIPGQAPGLISNVFYEDFKTNLNIVKNFFSTGIMDDFNSNFRELAGLTVLFDKDSDKILNDQEVINAVLDVSLNKVTVSNPVVLDIVLGFNPNYNKIKEFFNRYDIDNSSSLSKSELINLYNVITQANDLNDKTLFNLIKEYEDFIPIFNTINYFDIYKDAQYSDSAILQGLLNMRRNSSELFDNETKNLIMAQNEDSAGIQKLVNLIDPDEDGIYNNNLDVLNHAYEIWKGNISPTNLDYDFNQDGIVNNQDASTLYILHLFVNNKKLFNIV
jgi:Ca2+-binding EF-hand superfamily protein